MSSIWGKLGKIAAVAAPLALSFVPGVGPIAGAAGGGIWSKLAGAAPGLMTAAGQAMSNASDTAAHNRGEQASAQVIQQDRQAQQQRDFEQQLMARETSNRAGQDDAFRKMQQASYIAGGGASQAPAVSASGVHLGSMPFAPKAAGADETAGAAALLGQTRDSLMSGRYNARGGAPLPELNAPTPFQIDPKLLKAGIWEKLGGIAAPIAGAISPLLARKPGPRPMDEVPMGWNGGA